MKFTHEATQNLLNPRWRWNNLYFIIDKKGNRILFKENEVQAWINDNDSPRKLILKARQFGVSTSEIIKCLDYAIWHKNVTVCILAHKDDAIKKLFRIVKRAHKYMNPNIKPDIGKGGGSMYEMYFPRAESRIYCDLESRGDTINKLHVSEMAFMKNRDRVDATLQAVPIGGEVGIESTPKGMNHFHEMWTDKDSVYKKMFFPWYLHSEYNLPLERGEKMGKWTDEEINLIEYAFKEFKVNISPEQIKWRRWKIRETKALFFQEYPESDSECFLTSGEQVMDLRLLSKYLKAYKPGKLILDGNAEVFEEPERSKRYVIGADTSEGVSKDFSVAAVYEKKSRKHVATLRGKFKPKRFAELLDELGRYYAGPRRHPLIAVERNNHGHSVLLWLEEKLKYPDVFKHDDDRPGWKTNSMTRPIMLDTFIDGVDDEFVVPRDAQTLKECMTLVDNNGKIEAMDGKNDDCVIAHSIALQMCMEKDNYLDTMFGD